MKILVTGCAGFIGYHLTKRLLNEGHVIIGIDNMNDYYSVSLKMDRLQLLEGMQMDFGFFKVDLSDRVEVENLFKFYDFDIVINLAAQAGVRYSIHNPLAYQVSNLDGFSTLIEFAKNYNIKNFLYASSSSVYGSNKKIPFSEDDKTDSPISLYAATKKANELIAHSYNNNFGINTVGLRFFTVYGPYGRPDMAYYKFADAVIRGVPIDVYNHGKMKRDFTYVDDVVSGIILAMEKMIQQDMGCEVFNIGNSATVELERFISILEQEFSIEAVRKYMPLQTGDLEITYADLNKSKSILGYNPSVSIEEGLKRFADWYKIYHSTDIETYKR